MFLNWLLGKGRYPYLGLLLLTTAVFSFFALRIGGGAETESMVSRDEAQNRNYAAFRNAFGSDEEMLLSVTHPSLLAPEGLRLLDELTKEIGGFGGVRRVYSLTNARHAVPSPVGAESELLVPRPFDVPGVSPRVLSALDDNPKLASLLISRDRRTAGITIEIDDRIGADTSKSGVIDALRGLMARRAGEAELHLSGIAVQKHDVAEFVRRDKTFLVPLSMLVLATMLAITFRHFPGVLIPMAVKVVSVVWTMGAYAMAGYRLNPITALLPPLIIVLSISTSVHLYDGWLQIPEGSGDRVPRILQETRRLFLPSLFTSIATAFGLLALAVSDIPAVRQFGVFGALGVFVSFGLSATLVPVALSFFSPPRPEKISSAIVAVRRFLSGVAHLSTDWSRTVLAVALVPMLLTGGIMGYSGIDLNVGTAMIAPVVLGLVVDNTIHYLARYRGEYREDVLGAVMRTTTGAGRALFASSLILAFGFGVGGFGSFKPTVHFSLLAGGTMLAAVACVLLVLPACLVLSDRPEGGSTG